MTKKIMFSSLNREILQKFQLRKNDFKNISLRIYIFRAVITLWCPVWSAESAGTRQTGYVVSGRIKIAAAGRYKIYDPAKNYQKRSVQNFWSGQSWLIYKQKVLSISAIQLIRDLEIACFIQKNTKWMKARKDLFVVYTAASFPTQSRLSWETAAV